MNISGISTAQGSTYEYAAGSGKNASKIEEEIKQLQQKIKDVDKSFDSPKAKKAQKQQLEAQIQIKQTELQQAQQSNSNNNINNAACMKDDESSVQSDGEESGLIGGAIDIRA